MKADMRAGAQIFAPDCGCNVESRICFACEQWSVHWARLDRLRFRAVLANPERTSDKEERKDRSNDALLVHFVASCVVEV
jgi:hypothetical protein